ncbi:UNVERIFIED_CONTAM: hypothetical protein Sradi_7311200 [Sesamum radiatum]|uniref:Uncharacterized protein n=1 Tax=Sesamum radiatum TaxID=300843 RepID=A0AAW2I6V1_SESRA
MGPRRQGLVEPGSTKGLITFTSSDAEERRCRLRKGGLPSALFPYDQEETSGAGRRARGSKLGFRISCFRRESCSSGGLN